MYNKDYNVYMTIVEKAALLASTSLENKGMLKKLSCFYSNWSYPDNLQTTTLPVAETKY